MEQYFYLKEHFVMDYMVHHPRKRDTPSSIKLEKNSISCSSFNWQSSPAHSYQSKITNTINFHYSMLFLVPVHNIISVIHYYHDIVQLHKSSTNCIVLITMLLWPPLRWVWSNCQWVWSVLGRPRWRLSQVTRCVTPSVTAVPRTL